MTMIDEGRLITVGIAFLVAATRVASAGPTCLEGQGDIPSVWVLDLNDYGASCIYEEPGVTHEGVVTTRVELATDGSSADATFTASSISVNAFGSQPAGCPSTISISFNGSLSMHPEVIGGQTWYYSEPPSTAIVTTDRGESFTFAAPGYLSPGGLLNVDIRFPLLGDDPPFQLEVRISASLAECPGGSMPRTFDGLAALVVDLGLEHGTEQSLLKRIALAKQHHERRSGNAQALLCSALKTMKALTNENRALRFDDEYEAFRDGVNSVAEAYGLAPEEGTLEEYCFTSRGSGHPTGPMTNPGGVLG